MKIQIVSIVFVACTIYSCRPTLYLPREADVVKREKLLAGRRLYVRHCSSCHNLHFPKEYDGVGWEIQLDEMQKRAKITDNEKELIYDYLKK